MQTVIHCHDVLDIIMMVLGQPQTPIGIIGAGILS